MTGIVSASRDLPAPMPILDALERLYATRADEVERFLAGLRAEKRPHLTTSVDLRHSGLRVAPVDTNLYPAGFNNLSEAAVRRAASHMRDFVSEQMRQARRVLIVPENHTRNLAYLDSLAVLKRVLAEAGLETAIGSVSAASGEPLALESRSGERIEELPLIRKGEMLETESGFRPDFILLNNDCSSGVPAVLEGIAQPIFPPPSFGWHQRRKSVHFEAYCGLADEFGAAFGLDPWLICAQFHRCGEIDFKQKSGLDCLARAVDDLLAVTRRKYAEYGINDEPYVFIKADSGTYGMGIMTARGGEDILEINKKERNKMHVIKEGVQVTEVIIQEGIPTLDRVKDTIAEPMIYLIDGIPVGGMYRINASRDQFSNLNAAGMEFTGMCDETEEALDARQPVTQCEFHAFGLIAALAALAAGREEYP